MKFEVIKKSKKSKARVGKIITAHGEINTPIFMPVGTQGTIKSLTPEQVKAQGAEIILANTYHLFMRPGHELIAKAGGLHKFMQWDKPILTDSGGFQVFSLAELRKIKDNGVEFQSHLDGGQKHFFTPELVVDIQKALGSDIMMQLDVCPPHDVDKKEVADAVSKTAKWAKMAKEHFDKVCDPELQALFAIVQGGMFEDLRRQSAEELTALDLPGYAIGGVSVGEPEEELYRITADTAPLLPEDKPRYLMGVGKPENLLQCVQYGVDMFDCVIPTRLARHGSVFTDDGMLNINNAQYREDFTPLAENCDCYACQHFTRAYIKHLHTAKEILAIVLMTIHNIRYLIDYTSRLRQKILNDEL
jgi:queuine tRNA-ribosyltransferase